METYTSIGLNTANADRLVSEIRKLDLFPTAVDSTLCVEHQAFRRVTITVENVTVEQEQKLDDLEWHISHS